MSIYKIPKRIAAVSIVALLSSNAMAQETEMEEITVVGKYLSLDKLNSVKTPVPIINVPQSLSITTQAQIKDQAIQNFGDLLRYTPGLSISQGEGHRDAIIIRGVQTTADFYINGIRDDVQYYRPLYNIDQVEILRGSNALLFGRGGGGGVVNRVTKTAKVGESFNSINAGVDTFGAWSVALDSNTSAGEENAFRLNAYYQELDNHRDFFDGTSYAINPTFTFNLSEATTAKLSYEYVDDDRVIDRGVPSRKVASGPRRPVSGFEDTFFGSPEANVTTLEAHILSGRVEHDFNDSLRGNITLQYADYDKLYQNLFASDSVTVTNGTINAVELDGYLDTTERENTIIQGNLVGEFATGSIEHVLLVGAEYGNQDTKNARNDNVFAANNDDQLLINFTDPLRIPAFGFTKRARDRESEVQFTSLYIQDQISLTENFKVVLGARWDSFDIDVLDLIEQGDGDSNDGNFSREDNEVTPRLGLIYKPAENISIYVSYSETFLPRSGDQFLTLNLDSESTRPQFFENTEIGLKWDFTETLSFTAAAFSLERESFTSVDPEDAGQLIVIQGSQTDGLELQLLGNLTDSWYLSAGYAYLDGEVERVNGGGNDGNKTRQTPENMFSIWSRHQINQKFAFALGLTYQDSFFVREDNRTEVPSFTRVDAAAYYTVSEAVKLQLNIENLFDRDYFPDAHSNNNISTGESINARFSVVVDF